MGKSRLRMIGIDESIVDDLMRQIRSSNIPELENPKFEFDFLDPVREAYTKRFDHINASFKYVCDALSTHENEARYTDLKKYSEELLSNYKNKLDHYKASQYRKILAEYIQHLEFLLGKVTNLNARTLLAAADEYVVLTSPKPPLATVIKQPNRLRENPCSFLVASYKNLASKLRALSSSAYVFYQDKEGNEKLLYFDKFKKKYDLVSNNIDDMTNIKEGLADILKSDLAVELSFKNLKFLSSIKNNYAHAPEDYLDMTDGGDLYFLEMEVPAPPLSDKVADEYMRTKCNFFDFGSEEEFIANSQNFKNNAYIIVKESLYYYDKAKDNLSLIASNPDSIKQLKDLKLVHKTTLNSQQLERIKTIIGHSHIRIGTPLWYQGLPKEERVLFDFAMKGIHSTDELKNKIKAISSRHRILPGSANLSRHVTAVFNPHNQKVKIYEDRYRSSMVASRDIEKLELSKDDIPTLRNEYSSDNINHIIQSFFQKQIEMDRKKQIEMGKEPNEKIDIDMLKKTPILFQTLVTDIVPGMVGPDKQLYEDKLGAIKKLRDVGITIVLKVNGVDQSVTFTPMIFDTNHPLNTNIQRTGGTIHGSGDTKEQSLAICSVGDQSSDENIKHIAFELRLATDYTRFGNPAQNNEREMYLAALEELLISSMGGLVHGSCVSGKDRKGLETIYADSVRQFFLEWGRVPKLGDTSAARKAFVNIFARIYLSRHQQLNAGQNAPGADGIKTPEKYLPKDIIKAIKEQSHNKNIMKDTNRLAGNNDLNRVLQKVHTPLTTEQKSIFEDRAAVFLTPEKENATQNEEINVQNNNNAPDISATENFESLIKIIKDLHLNKQGQHLFWSSTPEGITKMRTYLNKVDLYKHSYSRYSSKKLVPVEGITPGGSFDDNEIASIIQALSKIAQSRLQKQDKLKLRSEMTTELYELVVFMARAPDDHAAVADKLKHFSKLLDKQASKRQERDILSRGISAIYK